MENRFLKRMYEFQERNEISKQEMKDMILDWFEPFKVFSRKVDGTRMVRDGFTVAGPSNNAVYDYEAKGYMVFQDLDQGGWRTIVLDNVYKIEKDGKTYLVR